MSVHSKKDPRRRLHSSIHELQQPLGNLTNLRFCLMFSSLNQFIKSTPRSLSEITIAIDRKQSKITEQVEINHIYNNNKIRH